MRNKIIFIALICAILFIPLAFHDMPDPIVWGLIPKSQIDSQTIDEAIASAIDAHNSDPTAHTGSGQSLDLHRGGDVLDHKPGSVLIDKTTFKEIVSQPTFESFAGWGTSGSVNMDDFPGVNIYIETGAVNLSTLFSQGQIPPTWFDTDYDMMFQVAGYWNGSNTHIDGFWGIGDQHSNHNDRLGFKIEDGILKGCAARGGTEVETSSIGIDISLVHVFRMQYEADVRSVDFYVDGELVGSLTMPSGNPSSDISASFWLAPHSTNDGNLIITNLIFARALVNP
jgi:hypothetical protein